MIRKTARTAVVGGVAAAAALAAATFAVLAPTATPHAEAASLAEVTNFGSNPGNLRMHVYVPGSVQASPPIVLAMHTCGGSGQGFYQSTEFASLADRYGFIVIFPSASKKSNCFDNWSEASKVRGGATDPVSLMSMVTYVEQQYHGDPARVYATGASSGGMMTNAMLALYPEVFKAGAAFMGVPFTCFPNEAAYSPGGNSAPCVNKSAQQWGDLVRAANPGFGGPWPRMQLWHGTSDNVVAYAELAEEIKQWTNVHGLGQTPTSSDTPQSGWTRQRFADASGAVRVEAISISGAGHVLPQSGMAAAAVQFFGLTSPSSSSATPSPSRSSGSPSVSPSRSNSSSASPSGSSNPGGSCKVAYATNAWNTGLTANLTITNTGTAAINGWSVGFTLPTGQTITSGWNASYSPASGAITATSVSYNAAIPAGGSTSIGFQATHTGNTDKPTSFTLNGAACTTA